MQSLPEQDYEYAEWRFARVGIDYHVEVDGYFYSVPHALMSKQVDTRATARTIEIFHRGKRVASHARRYGRNQAARHAADRVCQCAPALCRMVRRTVCSPGA